MSYLKSTVGKGILFNSENTLTVEGYTDTDYASSLVDRRSTTNYSIFSRGNLVSWRSKKHDIVARSSAETEFHAMALWNV